jgi:predicted nucleic acid-binding protein
MTWPEIREVLGTVGAVCRVEPLTRDTHERGLTLAERYGFTIYDGLILAAASLAGCAMLYTEDLQDGQAIEELTIRNPFATA